MSAKEMFEKLGYEIYFDVSVCLWYRKNVNGVNFNIRFSKDTKLIDCWYIFNDRRCDKNLTPNEIQAINKQVEELGWLGSDDNE
ncbi:MAG: hypothetical protein IKV94_02495 [Clostridia bacterium]|nr:hypothetical protein [Clostridia bacterium]MBR6517115.1 hypothetical protein [Bacilli bacterium]